MDRGVIERFEALTIPEPNSGCWLWLGAITENGYGQFSVRARKRVRPHRFAYERSVGPVPDGLELDHKCRTRCCVNPDHLEPVTHAENVRRGARARNGGNCCPRGHEYTPGNVIVLGGKNCCRECRRAANRAYRRRRRQREQRSVQRG